MTNITNILNLFKCIEDNTDMLFVEKIYQLTIKSKANAIDFKKIFDDNQNKSLLLGSHISFEFIYDDTTIRNGDFIDYYNQSIIKNEAEINLVISLNKKNLLTLENNTILFFYLDSFNENFHFINHEFINFFKDYDYTKSISIFIPIKETLSNELLKFHPLDQFKNIHPSINIKSTWKSIITRIKEDRDELSRVEELYPIPDIFNFRSKIPDEISTTLNKNLFYLSLLHLSNKTKEDTFIIRGQKTIEIKWDESFEPKHANILFQIYKFSFGIEQTEDKLEITRNILTVYLYEEPLSQLDEELENINSTIKRHFSLYVQNKIKKFFDDTKDAIELARKYALEAKEAADKIVGNINTAIITLITAVFSAIVIMSRGNYKFFIIAILLHIFFLILTFCFNRHFAKNKKGNIESIYNLTINNFINISKDEKNKIKKDYVDPALRTIDSNLTKYFWLCLSLIVILVTLIFIGNNFIDQSITQDITENNQKNLLNNVNNNEKLDSSNVYPKDPINPINGNYFNKENN